MIVEYSSLFQPVMVVGTLKSKLDAKAQSSQKFSPMKMDIIIILNEVKSISR